ncbi:FAD:protein FMN transferase [Flavivirga aquimarina]|uniref:FAD:protein FMN transferase n=1 Tax=Flavivirga aquimarina TaxID=2027862 RepID=A0ABT8WF25_9FLAO|nr:FAD:protein FMN transferase [Flavivirga aquimarina]MDO5971619.1 FAD:protein FMN transferase [Flavivirga aquimarina]
MLKKRMNTTYYFKLISRKKLYNYFSIIVSIFFVFILVSCKEVKNTTVTNFKNTKLSGTVFGTFYEITYDSEISFQKEFDSLFYVINKSLSTYQANSDISRINRNESVTIDEHFENVFQASKEIYNETHGAFDPTIGAVVNAWDFGPEGKIVNLDSLKIDSLMLTVGFNKVLRTQNTIAKPKGTFLDFNAIAKGYAVDVIAKFLDNKSIQNYIVNIGGELNAKGINIEKNTDWMVGVEKPNFDGTQSLSRILALSNEAMATSGTYRKFKIDKNGNRFSHIIDTKTGYPSKTNLLSISVVAKDCMTADAYATAFKTMGIEKVKMFLKSHPELKVFLIFENNKKEFETLSLNGFPENEN